MLQYLFLPCTNLDISSMSFSGPFQSFPFLTYNSSPTQWTSYPTPLMSTLNVSQFFWQSQFPHILHSILPLLASRVTPCFNGTYASLCPCCRATRARKGGENFGTLEHGNGALKQPDWSRRTDCMLPEFCFMPTRRIFIKHTSSKLLNHFPRHICSSIILSPAQGASYPAQPTFKLQQFFQVLSVSSLTFFCIRCCRFTVALLSVPVSPWFEGIDAQLRPHSPPKVSFAACACSWYFYHKIIH